MEGVEIMASKDFWRGKKVFITGHTGFKGSWLSLWLSHWEAEVTGYSLQPPTVPSLYELARAGENIASIIADIRDGNILTQTLQDRAPEIVIHMAAQPLVRESYKDPAATYQTNVMGTVNLLEAVRHCKSVKAVVNVTTDKCYENKEWVWGYRENEPMGGYDPYSNSKACSELVTSSYRNSFFNPNDFANHGVALASARAGNVIGGGDWALDRLIPDCIRAFLHGETILIRNPKAIRPWQHVLEPLSGYLLLAQRLYENGPKYAEAWNFGPEDSDARPVEWIVKHLCERWGQGAAYAIVQGNHPHEANYLKLDCSKAKSLLDWRPRWNLEKALDMVLKWSLAYKNGADLKQVCLNQIEEYIETT
mgnify:CR=1 FL=1